MASINTNVSAITALQTLNSVQSNLQTTQDRISTGFKVQSAKDNAAYFSISSTMRGDVGALGASQENLAVIGSSVAVARKGAEQIMDIAKQIVERAAFAESSTVDAATVQLEIDDLAAMAQDILDQSTYQGEDLLTGTAAVTVTTGVTRAGGTFATTTFDFNAVGMDTVVTALAAVDVTGGSATAAAETQLAAATTAATTLGLVEKRIDMQREFVGKLSDEFTKGIGSMVDADMNKEAARLQALQVQQQLATQSLGIANQSPQNILSLFR